MIILIIKNKGMDSRTIRKNFLKDLSELLSKYESTLEIEVNGGGHDGRDRAELGLGLPGVGYVYLLDTNFDSETVFTPNKLLMLANGE